MSGQPPKSVLTGPIGEQEPLLIHDLPTDNVVATITALAGELFVVKDRLAALELELERAGVVAGSSLEGQQLNASERKQRQQELDGFVQRIMSELTRDRTPSSQIRKQAYQYLSAYGASEDDS